jgi:serine/threonine protein kinase
MMTVLSVGAMILAACAALLALGAVGGLLWLLWKALKGLFRLLGHVLGFVRREVVDSIQTAGALVTAGCTIPLSIVNLLILRLGAAKHYARAFGDELKGVGGGLWRVALGNPLRLVGLGAIVERVEQRLPEVMERAPRGRRARRAAFDGYEVIGTLPSGGSGAQLFVARPKGTTQRRFLAAGRALPSEVVIKSFALESGSTLPQIVRESRALEAASRLGLVCEHQLTKDHFYYVMPFVKGDDLERVTRALHARATPEGLADAELRLVLGYAIDLLDELARFHAASLWHKDVKPSNVIVARGRAHLVDFGLVTPLASALTLTTHGTEYYRDPEMVRLAMQGVKVHEVDGVRFDLYSAGAVLYAMLENCFPAHGSLSRLSKRAPEALRWIVQRAMAELSSRYPSAAEMRADLAALAAAADPFGVRPADLPSFQREGAPLASPAFSSSLPPPRAAWVGTAGDEGVESDARPVRSRRRRLALAGATGAAALVCAAFALGGREAAHARAFERRTRLAHDRIEPRRAWSHLSEPERRVLDLAEGVARDLVPTQETNTPDFRASATPAAETAAASPVQADLPAGGRVLVLEDVTTSVDPRVLALLRSRLAERAYRVVGEESEEPAAAEGVELLAHARHVLGLGRADEPETQRALQDFLDSTRDLAGLILVSRAEEGGEHCYRVFLRDRAEVAVREAD